MCSDVGYYKDLYVTEFVSYETFMDISSCDNKVIFFFNVFSDKVKS